MAVELIWINKLETKNNKLEIKNRECELMVYDVINKNYSPVNGAQNNVILSYAWSVWDSELDRNTKQQQVVLDARTLSNV